MVDKKLLSERAFRKSLVMHPLPRVDELAYELDADPRSRYFRAGAPAACRCGWPSLALLLGAREVDSDRRDVMPPPKTDYPTYAHDSAMQCPNPSASPCRRRRRNTSSRCSRSWTWRR